MTSTNRRGHLPLRHRLRSGLTVGCGDNNSLLGLTKTTETRHGAATPRPSMIRASKVSRAADASLTSYALIDRRHAVCGPSLDLRPGPRACGWRRSWRPATGGRQADKNH